MRKREEKNNPQIKTNSSTELKSVHYERARDHVIWRKRKSEESKSIWLGQKRVFGRSHLNCVWDDIQSGSW